MVYLFLVRLFLLNQFTEVTSLLDMLINYSLYAILGSLFVFSLKQIAKEVDKLVEENQKGGKENG